MRRDVYGVKRKLPEAVGEDGVKAQVSAFAFV